MFSNTLRILLLGLLLWPWSTANAMNATGQWDLQANGILPDVQGTCLFQGTANVVQNGNAISGDATLMLQSGPQACPPEMMAQIQGAWETDTLLFGALLGGNLGEASFSTGPVVRAVQLGGSYIVTSGPFNGVSGSWQAVMRAVAAAQIPTLATLGVVLLAALLFGVGGMVLRRQHH